MKTLDTLTAYLDQCARERGTIESSERHALYRAAQADGWNTAEIEQAWRRRFQ